MLHDLNLAGLYCRRLAFLRGGRVLAEGPTDEVLTYANVRATYDVYVYVLPLDRRRREEIRNRFGR